MLQRYQVEGGLVSNFLDDIYWAPTIFTAAGSKKDPDFK